MAVARYVFVFSLIPPASCTLRTTMQPGGGGTPLRDTVCLAHVLLCQSRFTLRYPACDTPAVGIGELPRRRSTTDPIEIPHMAWVEKTIYSHHHNGGAAAIRASNQVIKRFYSFKSTGSGTAGGSMLAEEGEPSIYVCVCVCVCTRLCVCIQTHSLWLFTDIPTHLEACTPPEEDRVSNDSNPTDADWTLEAEERS